MVKVTRETQRKTAKLPGLTAIRAVINAPSGEDHGRLSNGIFEVCQMEQLFLAIENAVDELPSFDNPEEGEPVKLTLSALVEKGKRTVAQALKILI